MASNTSSGSRHPPVRKRSRSPLGHWRALQDLVSERSRSPKSESEPASSVIGVMGSDAAEDVEEDTE